MAVSSAMSASHKWVKYGRMSSMGLPLCFSTMHVQPHCNTMYFRAVDLRDSFRSDANGWAWYSLTPSLQA